MYVKIPTNTSEMQVMASNSGLSMTLISSWIVGQITLDYGMIAIHRIYVA